MLPKKMNFRKTLTKQKFIFSGQMAAIKSGGKNGNYSSTVKHAGGNILLWECISANLAGNLVFIDGNVDQQLI